MHSPVNIADLLWWLEFFEQEYNAATDWLERGKYLKAMNDTKAKISKLQNP